MSERNQFQDEVILPSRGLLNPDIPGGRVTIQMMGTQEEKLLAGSRGRGGRLISQLLERLIVEPKIDPLNLLMTDRSFLLLKIRSLTFGDIYGFKHKCPECGKTSRFEVNLADLDVRTLPDGFIEPFSVTLPLCGETIFVRFLRGYDDEAVSREAKKSEERMKDAGDPAYLPTLARLISHTSTLAENDIVGKLLFVQNLKSRDSLHLSQAIEAVSPSVDMDQTLECPACGAELEVTIPFGEEFFRPKLARAR